jgi:hypothetical protein
MVARDVVEILADIHADPFQSGFDSQHRQDLPWIEDVDGLIPSYLIFFSLVVHDNVFCSFAPFSAFVSSRIHSLPPLA